MLALYFYFLNKLLCLAGLKKLRNKSVSLFPRFKSKLMAYILDLAVAPHIFILAVNVITVGHK